MQETKYIINQKPRAWVGCLGCYNSGSLRGLWVDGVDAADTDGAGLSNGGRCLKCGGDEFWVLDHENYGDLLGGECSTVEAATIAAAIQNIEERGEDIERVMAYASNCNLSLDDWDEWRVQYEDAVLHHATIEEYAEEMLEIGLFGDIPESLAGYIDVKAIARDLEMSGEIWEKDGWLFRNL